MRQIFLLSVFVLAACTVKPTFSPEQGKAVAQACIEEVRAPGVYSVSAGQHSSNPEGTLPRAWAVERLGGTSSGATAINACIKRRAGS